MLRAYIRKIKGLSIASQHKMADEDGVKANARYEESTGEVSRTLDEAIASIRAGDVLWIADTTILADGRPSHLRVLAELKEKKITVREGRTRRVSVPPHDGQYMLADAYTRWASANKGFGALTPEDAGKLGGKAAARARRKLKLPKTEAAKIWFDKALADLKTDEITARINTRGRELGFLKEWSVPSLYRAFKGRGVYAGPKVKK